MFELAFGPGHTPNTVTPRDLQAGAAGALQCTQHVSIKAHVRTLGKARSKASVDGVSRGFASPLGQRQPPVCSIDAGTHPSVAPRCHDQESFWPAPRSVEDARHRAAIGQRNLHVHPVLPNAQIPSGAGGPSSHPCSRGRRTPESHQTC